MYQCDHCGAVFHNPGYDQPPVYHINPGGYECIGEPVCPECGAYEFTEVKECSRCGTMTPETGAALCDKCRIALLVTLNHFFDQLTPDQLDQFDSWMDGDSIHNRNKWR